MPLSHHWAPALSSRFVVVHWDQRGAGRSFSSALQPSQLSLEQLIEDAVELVKHLKTRFADRPIVLLGQSWGTLLGAHIAAMRPELFCAYVGVGQMVDAQENLRLSHRFALGRARRTQHKTALSRLNQMKPPTAKDIPEVMRWVTTFGGSLKGQKDHRLLEKIRARSQVPQTPSEKTFADQAFSMGVLAPAIMQLNLMERIPKFRLPVIFMAGRHDHVTPSALAKRYLDRLKAPEKRFIWFENSAHYPHIEQTKRFAETMTNAVLSHCSNL